MKNKPITIFLVCILSSANILSQESDIKIINGKTIDAEMNPIPFVNIKTSGITTIYSSNIKGEFKIETLDSDTLSFSATGFKTIKIPVKMLNSEINYVTLFEAIYELNTVDISAMKWQDLKYEMIHGELKREDQKILQIPGLIDPYTKLVPVSMIGSPISLIYELLKKENIRKRQMKRWGKTYKKTYIKVK